MSKLLTALKALDEGIDKYSGKVLDRLDEVDAKLREKTGCPNLDDKVCEGAEWLYNKAKEGVKALRKGKNNGN